MGYALGGRGFSYVGFAPLYIGEITLVFGLIAFSFNPSFLKVINLHPAWLLAAFMTWCCLNTVPYIPFYGILAIRDAALWYYCSFAFIISTLLIAKPKRFLLVWKWHKTFAIVFMFLMPIVKIISPYTPTFPGAPSPIISNRPGNLAIALSGVSAFALRIKLMNQALFIAIFMIDIYFVAVGNRAGLVAFLSSLALIFAANPNIGKIWRLLIAILFIALFIALLNPDLIDPIANKALSIIGANQYRQGTIDYRLDWWQKIIDYTFGGDYFWTGKGFGINLGVDAGFDPLGDGLVRSPHNGHITILARSGVPGFILWILTQISWSGAISLAYVRSTARANKNWATLFLSLLAYWLATMITTGFEVIIEGPVGAIWLWSVYGVGLAALYHYRYNPHILSANEYQLKLGQSSRNEL